MILPTLLCALYALPGPTSIKFQNSTFQAYSINRRLCPCIDPIRDSTFELYTRQNPLVPQMLYTNDQNSVESSNINFSNPTIIFFHGFLESSTFEASILVRDSYVNRADYNVIIANNERLIAGPDYITAASNCLPIGQFTAKFLDYLVSFGLNLQTLHLVGFSLGAQIAGLTSKNMISGRPQRITGLDPAGPIFDLLPETERLISTDAEFVDILHSNAGFFGSPIMSGHVDVWFNGGTKQPGCSPVEVLARVPGGVVELVFCSHFQAYRVYAKSIREPQAYTLTKCTNYIDFQNGLCNSNDQIFLGENMDQTARGNYYITTGVTAQ